MNKIKHLIIFIVNIFITINCCGQVVKYTSANLNVRSGPSIKYAIIGTVAVGTEIIVSDENFINNDWLKIRYSGQVGYISTQYLSNYKISDTQNVYQNGKSANSIGLSEMNKYSTDQRMNLTRIMMDKMRALEHSNGTIGSVDEYMQQFGQFSDINTYRGVGGTPGLGESMYDKEITSVGQIEKLGDTRARLQENQSSSTVTVVIVMFICMIVIMFIILVRKEKREDD